MSAPSSDLGQCVEMVAWKLRIIMIQSTHDKKNLKLFTLGHHYLKSGEGDAGGTWKKAIFCKLWNFGNAHLANRTHKLQQIWNRDKLGKSNIFFLFTDATRYYHTFCLLITYFASFTHYEDDMFIVISN